MCVAFWQRRISCLRISRPASRVKSFRRLFPRYNKGDTVSGAREALVGHDEWGEKGGQMKEHIHRMRRFLAAEDGPTSIEYALMLALIVIVCLAFIRAIGTNANSRFHVIAHSLS